MHTYIYTTRTYTHTHAHTHTYTRTHTNTHTIQTPPCIPPTLIRLHNQAILTFRVFLNTFKWRKNSSFFLFVCVCKCMCRNVSIILPRIRASNNSCHFKVFVIVFLLTTTIKCVLYMNPYDQPCSTVNLKISSRHQNTRVDITTV